MAEAKAVSILSKKRYTEIYDAACARFGDGVNGAADVDAFMSDLRAIMNFDPCKKQYTPEAGRRCYDRVKQKARETGQSVYVVSGKKAREARKKMVTT